MTGFVYTENAIGYCTLTLSDTQPRSILDDLVSSFYGYGSSPYSVPQPIRLVRGHASNALYESKRGNRIALIRNYFTTIKRFLTIAERESPRLHSPKAWSLRSISSAVVFSAYASFSSDSLSIFFLLI